MRKRKRRLRVDIATGTVGLLVVSIVTIMGPRLYDWKPTQTLVAQNALKSERIEVLEDLIIASHRNNNALRAQLAENNLLRNKAYGQLDEVIDQRDKARDEVDRLKSQLAEQRGKLEAELASAKDKIRQLNADVQLANAKVTQNRELESRYALATERDAALSKVKEAEDRIRELTLKLSQNGIWP